MQHSSGGGVVQETSPTPPAAYHPTQQIHATAPQQHHVATHHHTSQQHETVRQHHHASTGHHSASHHHPTSQHHAATQHHHVASQHHGVHHHQDIMAAQVSQQGVVSSSPAAQIQEAHSSTTNHIGSQSQDPEVAMDAYKNAIYRHPLMPLIALLMDKCEQATQTPDCPSSESFDVDIQQFVQAQEQQRKPFFSEDPELDSLMLRAIQVLRIHLLELEKVNELCKDFCTRYISCLKGKLQSENLLRTDGIPSGMESPTTPTTPGTPTLPSSQGSGSSVMMQQSGGMSNLQQGQIVSGGTVYQMVQTPQGLVAQPIQLPNSGGLQSPGGGQIIHGSTPLSQIGVATGPLSNSNSGSNPMLMSPSGFSSDEDDSTGGKKKSKRGVLPKQATQVMKSWLFQHIVHPYPTEDEKRQIAGQTNLTLLQVNNWFINARRRILQPMLDASNPEQKVKKNKTQSRPVQRFWPDNIANLQAQGTPQSPTSPQTPLSPRSQESEPSTPTPSSVGQPGTPSDHQGSDVVTAATTQPQHIVLPPGTVVTSDGRIINASTGAPAIVSLSQPGQSVSQALVMHNGASHGTVPLQYKVEDSAGLRMDNDSDSSGHGDW